MPKKNDAKYIFNLIKDGGTLDVNSEYLYLLQATDFRSSCCVALDDEQIIGFVSGYVLPDKKDTLFIWQVAVDQNYRGQNLAKNMILEIFNRDELGDIKNIYATVSPSNIPSRRVFEKIAAGLGVGMVEKTLFEISDFNDAHEEEVLYKIGPTK